MDVFRPVGPELTVIGDAEVRMAVAILSAGTHRTDVTTMTDELEREGQPVTLVCLDRTRHEHEDAVADVVHLPLLSAAIVSSTASRVARDPGRILRIVGRLLAAVTTPRVTASSLLRVPGAIHLAKILAQRGITDVQGIDAVASKVALAVRELLDDNVPDLSELGVDWSRLSAPRIGIRWFSRRINSIAAEMSLDGDSERIVVKRQRTHAGGVGADRCAHEYRILTSLTEAMNDRMLTVPRVLLFDEEAAVLVMERARGTALDALFAAAAEDHGRMDRLVHGIRGAGAWLAAMQAATRRTADGRALLADLVSIAIDDVAKIAGHDRRMRRHQRRIVRRLRTLEGRVSTKPLTVAGHHDDYWPGNLFFDGKCVTVIDFESFRDGLRLEDAAYFLIRSDMLRRRFRLHFPDLAQRFFEGYCPGQTPDLEALQLFTVTKGLRALAKGVGDDLALLQRLWTRRTIHHAVLRASSDQR